MKRFFLTLCCCLWAATPLWAQEAQFLTWGLGNAQGTTDFVMDPADETGMTSALSHSLTGQTMTLGYSSVGDGGLMWGLGYHSYSLSGKESWTSETTVGATNLDVTWTLKTTDFKVTGSYVAVGYGFGETFRLIPQVRVGLSNKFTFTESLSSTRTLGDVSASGSDSYSLEQSGNWLVLVLPFYYVGETFIFGAEYHKSNASLELSSSTNETTSTFTASLSSAMLLTLGLLF